MRETQRPCLTPAFELFLLMNEDDGLFVRLSGIDSLICAFLILNLPSGEGEGYEGN